ncbi:hypothetical protein OH77DRAFT_1395502 [Trametes cingulata]|nr:hypothetical protein OH77DRAFT_1395502 [Trametes cingulata]
MHRCLLLPDILQRILDILLILPRADFYGGYQQFQDKNPSLARLARTCRRFLEPCLDVLWRHQRTLAPLVRTLPADVYEETLYQEPLKPLAPRFCAITLIRPLVQSDWSRFDYYAPRIKALGSFHNEFADEEGTSWHMSSDYPCERLADRLTVSQLAFYRRGRWLLPNLVRLRWNVWDLWYNDHMPLFFSPSLRSLAFGFWPGAIPPHDAYACAVQYCIAPILEGLDLLCPSLTDLEMYAVHPVHIVEAAANFALEAAELEGYVVNSTAHFPCHPSFLVHLAARPRLRKLFLHVEFPFVEDIAYYFADAGIFHPFPSLQNLYLKAPRIELCIAILESMPECRLFSLTVEIDNRPLAVDVARLFKTIHARCAKSTLHACRTIGYASGEGDEAVDRYYPDYAVDMSILRPMLQFPNMRAFRFGLPLLGWLHDEDLQAVGEAWPGLVTFAFLDHYKTPCLTPATWKGVAALICRAPILTSLRVHFDTKAIIITGPADVPGLRPNQQLRFLDISNSVLIDDPMAFAQSLFTIAPRVVSVSAVGWTSLGMEPMHCDPRTFCEEVDKVMCLLRAEKFGIEYLWDRLGRTELAGEYLR